MFSAVNLKPSERVLRAVRLLEHDNQIASRRQRLFHFKNQTVRHANFWQHCPAKRGAFGIVVNCAAGIPFFVWVFGIGQRLFE